MSRRVLSITVKDDGNLVTFKNQFFMEVIFPFDLSNFTEVTSNVETLVNGMMPSQLRCEGAGVGFGFRDMQFYYDVPEDEVDKIDEYIQTSHETAKKVEEYLKNLFIEQQDDVTVHLAIYITLLFDDN